MDVPGTIRSSFKDVKKLFLSHNNLFSLKGIERFDNLTHLSIASNYIQGIEELEHIKNPELITSLSIKGNTGVERHPDYKALLLLHFKNLKELDG